MCALGAHAGKGRAVEAVTVIGMQDTKVGAPKEDVLHRLVNNAGPWVALVWWVGARGIVVSPLITVHDERVESCECGNDGPNIVVELLVVAQIQLGEGGVQRREGGQVGGTQSWALFDGQLRKLPERVEFAVLSIA